MNLFVYGTLLKGLVRQSVLRSSRYEGPGLIRAELFDLGVFPGLHEGRDAVVGEIYQVDDETINTLDNIEGHRTDRPSESYFIRKQVRVRKFADGETVEAACYLFNQSAPENKIIHGDYRRYRIEQESEDQWVLAYGSNMSINRLEERIGKISEHKKCFIDNFELIFNKKAGGIPAVYANIVYSPDGARCPAAAYKLTPEQLATLDGFEGVPNHYMRMSIPYSDESSETNFAQVYIAHPDQLVSGLLPTPEYLEHIRTGYREHGFDGACLQGVVCRGKGDI